MESRQRYWESVYQDNDHERVGWYQANPTRSMSFIQDCALDSHVPVVDIGGGSSALVDCLLGAGYTDVTVLDLSATALGTSRARLGLGGDAVTWIEGDVTEHQFDRVYQLWHDRAVLHFLLDGASQLRYVEQLRRSLAVGGDAIIATFSLDGPPRCSGLPVVRYSEESLGAMLGESFEPLRFEYETHQTPGGVSQRFLYGHFGKRPTTVD